MHLRACLLNHLDFTISELYTPALGLRYRCFNHNLMDLLSCVKMVTLCKKCTYSEFSGLHVPTFGMNTDIYSVNLQIQYEYGKMWPRKTPYCSRSEILRIECYHLLMISFIFKQDP